MSRISKIVLFCFTNFGPLIVFYAANHFWGLKPAIIVSLVFTAFEVAYQIKKKEKITVFFKFCVVTTVGFGVFDLYMAKSVLFKYEPALTNLFVAGFFGLSLFSEKSLIQEFAGKNHDPTKFTPDHEYYFRAFTLVWTFYYIVKASVYFWGASRYTIEEGLIMRATAGNVSDFIMIGVSVLGGRFFFRALQKAKMLPSQRARKTIPS